MLILQKIIGEGMVRTCYFHPQDDKKCVKVVKNSKDIKSLQRELQTYEKVKNRLSPFICHYDQQLIETDKGPGLVVELIRDDNGEIAPKLSAFLKQQSINTAIKKQFDDFFRKLLDNRLYFTDFNLDNFLVFQEKGEVKIRYIDLKSYRLTRSVIKLEVLLPFLWRPKTIRRMNQLYKRLNLEQSLN